MTEMSFVCVYIMCVPIMCVRVFKGLSGGGGEGLSYFVIFTSTYSFNSGYHTDETLEMLRANNNE